MIDLILAAVAVGHSCAWAHPGADPFMGSVPDAVDHYTQIPAETQVKLKRRLARREYDEIVEITGDALKGKSSYDSTIRGMHFGSQGKICDVIDRSSWTPTMVERGLVYCEDDYCILVPTVCRNVSWIMKLPDEPPVKVTEVPPVFIPPEVFSLPPNEGYVIPQVPDSPPTAFVPPTTFTQSSWPPSYLSPPAYYVSGGPCIYCVSCPPQVAPSPIPEPSTWVLFSSGLFLGVWKLKRKRHDKMLLQPMLKNTSSHGGALQLLSRKL